nr:DUF2971 domain-containing protein [Bacteroidota bacterium]
MDIEKVKELIKIGVQKGQYPQYVYKYRVSDTTKNPYFDSILTTNSLMFSSPKAFNDPFDCQLQPVTFPTQTEVSQFLSRVLPHAPADVISNLTTNAIGNPADFAKILEDAINFDDKGVLCLSQEPDNILLWSHYADNHYGVCLKFDILQDLEFFSIPLTVIYDQSYPVYNHLTQPKEIVKKMIKTKFELWKYEKEIRIFKQQKNLYHFNKTSLIEIIFGCNTPQPEIDRIKNIANANGYAHLTFKQTKKKNGIYGLKLKIV